MKVSWSIFLIFIAFQAHSAEVSPNRSTLRCLGLEELSIHKNRVFGPVYKLNQRLIEELTTFGDIELNKEYYEKICKPKGLSVSVALLKNLLLNKKKLFNIPKKSHIPASEVKRIFIIEFISKAELIFFDYIFSIQGMMTRAKCLEEEVPELATLLYRYKSLRDVVDSSTIIKDSGGIKPIIQRLDDLDSIYKKCQQTSKKDAAKKKN
ncbi:MAG: hypothetical protein HOE90_14940 [Bacteriovoracaceae bacterium]|jgi:hypothetical protein|nr:hypothetical protein [Bacteriovoracaceae bacterium]